MAAPPVNEHAVRFGPPRRIVIVSGPPASGKTTLARPLARHLGFALLSKDDIKESLYISMGGAPGDLDLSRRSGDAAMDLLWVLATRCPAVVIEANFRTRSLQERARVAALDGKIVEIYCRVPLEEASRRFAERAREARHHPAHPLAEMPPERMAEYDGPFGMSPVIEIDTTRPVDLLALVQRVSSSWTLEESSAQAAGDLE
ncbi:MAG: AAA family ATPase [Acidobacteriaceae bacterium]